MSQTDGNAKADVDRKRSHALETREEIAVENENPALNPNKAPAAEDLRSETGKARVENVPDNLSKKQAKQPTRFVAWALLLVGIIIIAFMVFAYGT